MGQIFGLHPDINSHHYQNQTGAAMSECVCCWNAFLKGQHSILMEPGGCSGLGVTKSESARCILYFWCMSDGLSTISSLLFRSFLSLFRHQSHNFNWKCRHLSSSRLLHSSCVSSEPVMNPLLFEFPLPCYKMSLLIHPLFSFSSLFLFLPLHLFSLHHQANFLLRSHLNWGWFAGIMFS